MVRIVLPDCFSSRVPLRILRTKYHPSIGNFLPNTQTPASHNCLFSYKVERELYVQASILDGKRNRDGLPSRQVRFGLPPVRVPCYGPPSSASNCAIPGLPQHDVLSYTLTCGVDQLHVRPYVPFVSHCGGMPGILLRMLTNHSASENYQACALAIRFGVSLVAIISRRSVITLKRWRMGGHGDDAGTYTCTKLPNCYYCRIDGHQRLLVVI